MRSQSLQSGLRAADSRPSPFWPVDCIAPFAVIDSLTDSFKEKKVNLATNQDLNSQASFRSTLGGGSPEAVPAPGLKTKNDGDNLALDRDTRLLAENTRPFSLASNLMLSTTSQVREPIQEGKRL
jgi:hypothetical protein